MKYTITGAAGNITQPLAKALLTAGHEVTVIGRSESKLTELVQAGAKPAIGSLEDVAFLKEAFTGADAVYTMVPPNYMVTDWLKYHDEIGEIYATAIRATGIKYVVNLSSMGAHLATGAGPVSGLYRVEALLNELTDVHIKHLRPAYFYNNLLNMVGMIKGMGIMGSNFGGNGGKLTMAHPADIAKAATEELTQLSFTGHSVRYIVGDEKSGAEIAQTLGVAIGKTDLPWIEFTDEQALQGMLQAGLRPEQASKFTEMGECLRTGKMGEDFYKHPTAFPGITLDDFSKEFAAVYNG